MNIKVTTSTIGDGNRALVAALRKGVDLLWATAGDLAWAAWVIRLQDELAETVEAYWDAIAVPDPGCHWCEDKRHDMCPKHTCENPGPDFCPWAVHERCCLHVCGEDER